MAYTPEMHHAVRNDSVFVGLSVSTFLHNYYVSQSSDWSFFG